jgi:predicted DNA-binding mobile mystery protein A
MSVKRAALRQYQDRVDSAATQVRALEMPAEGWLRTMRKALGMSGPQLAGRMGVTRARIASAEQSELSGGITIKSMQAAAEAMGCRYVYAIVPPESVERLIDTQAQKKARALAGLAGSHMALEDQTLTSDRRARDVARLAQELARDMPRDFWDKA